MRSRPFGEITQRDWVTKAARSCVSLTRVRASSSPATAIPSGSLPNKAPAFEGASSEVGPTGSESEILVAPTVYRLTALAVEWSGSVRDVGKLAERSSYGSLWAMPPGTGVVACLRDLRRQAAPSCEDNHLVVIGMVELSGLVIEHEEGYRAKQARIIEVWVEDSPETARAIAARYPEVQVHDPFGEDEEEIRWT